MKVYVYNSVVGWCQ